MWKQTEKRVLDQKGYDDDDVDNKDDDDDEDDDEWQSELCLCSWCGANEWRRQRQIMTMAAGVTSQI